MEDNLPYDLHELLSQHAVDWECIDLTGLGTRVQVVMLHGVEHQELRISEDTADGLPRYPGTFVTSDGRIELRWCDVGFDGVDHALFGVLDLSESVVTAQDLRDLCHRGWYLTPMSDGRWRAWRSLDG